MGLEIERKFLINQPRIIEYAVDRQDIRQGYLNLAIERTVRVRVVGNGEPFMAHQAWLTVKGKNNGAVRREYEYRIPENDGEEMLLMCGDKVLEKVRHVIPFNDLTVELDVFGGSNEGLMVAEIEFEESDKRGSMTEEELRIHLPHWLDEEVTHDARYYNSSLITTPYVTWEK